MPPRRNPPADPDPAEGAAAAVAAPAVNEDVERNNRAAANLKFTGKLDGKASYKFWAQQLDSYAYGKGKAYSVMHAQGMSNNAEADPSPVDDDTDARRNFWANIFNSLTQAEAKKVRTIHLGEVEKLIRAVKKLYDARSETGLDLLRGQIESVKLLDHIDLDHYFAFNEELHDRLASYEKLLDDNDKRYYLLKGLPGEFLPATTSLTLPGVNYSWDQIKDYLKEFTEKHPNVPGKTKDHNSAGSAGKVFSTFDGPKDTSNNGGEVCKNFALKGTCKYGSSCKYRHVERPGQGGQGGGRSHNGHHDKGKSTNTDKCFSCDKVGHRSRDCPTPCGFCGKRGHGEQRCHIREKAIGQLKAQQADRTHSTKDDKEDAAEEDPADASFVTSSHTDECVYDFTFTCHEDAASSSGDDTPYLIINDNEASEGLIDTSNFLATPKHDSTYVSGNVPTGATVLDEASSCVVVSSAADCTSIREYRSLVGRLMWLTKAGAAVEYPRREAPAGGPHGLSLCTT